MQKLTTSYIDDLILHGKYPDVSKVLNKHKINAEKLNKLKKSNKIISLCYFSKCNLKCPYCVASMYLNEVQEIKTVVDEIGIDQFQINLQKLINVFKKDGSKIHLVFASGDMGMAPEFEQLFQQAFENDCSIGIQTNLHYASKYDNVFNKYPYEWIEKNVGFNVSYHLGTYLDRKFSDQLRKNFIYEYLPVLVEYNVQSNIIIPLTPKVLFDEQFEYELNYFKSIFDDKKLNIHLVELVHKYEGKKYPDSFTTDERKRMYELLDKYSNRQKPTEKKSLEMNEFYYLKGVRCFLPSRAIQIVPNGDLIACEYEKNGISGNIKNPDGFENALSDKSYIKCPFNVCHCSSAGFTYALDMADITIDKYVNELKNAIEKL